MKGNSWHPAIKMKVLALPTSLRKAVVHLAHVRAGSEQGCDRVPQAPWVSGPSHVQCCLQTVEEAGAGA